MAFKTILVPVRGDGKGKGVLEHALALAGRFNAHLDVVHTPARPEDMLPFGSIGITEDMRKQIVESASAAAAAEDGRLQGLLKDYLENKGVSIVAPGDRRDDTVTASWHSEAGKQAANVAVLGRLADLIVVAKPNSESRLGRQTLEAALLETGKPVMMAPPAPAPAVIGTHVAVGWDGGTESAKVVSATLTLMKAAERVTVFSAPVSTEPRLAAERLADYLGRHGIEAKINFLDVEATEVGNALLNGAGDVGADVLVMGGYGHSRARQLIFGGVTSHIIETAEMPVILVH